MVKEVKQYKTSARELFDDNKEAEKCEHESEQNMSEIKLLPCPCCGGEAKLTTQRHREYKPTFAVRCTNFSCRLETPSDKSKNIVIAIWNRRKPYKEKNHETT